MLKKHVMPTPPLPTNLLMQVWQKALPSVFVIGVSGAGRFGELQLHGWTPVGIPLFHVMVPLKGGTMTMA